MDGEEERELLEEIQRVQKEYLDEIKGRLVELLQEAIQEKVYDVSDNSMTWWDRTDAFKNSVDVKFEGDNGLFIYPNTNKMEYYSYTAFQKTNNNVSEHIPELLEYGHHSSKPNQYGMYRDYSAREYLETAINKMKSEFPDLQFEIAGGEDE